MGHYPPLTYKDFITGLKAMGFSKREQKSTAHEQWVRDDPYRKVTVTKHHAPFHRELLKNMIRQTGTSKKKFYKKCGK